MKELLKKYIKHLDSDILLMDEHVKKQIKFGYYFDAAKVDCQSCQLKSLVSDLNKILGYAEKKLTDKKAVLSIYDNSFTNYISPSKYEKLLNIGWNFEETKNKKETIKRIAEILKDNNNVKGGYMCSSIRGVHSFYILYKNK